MTPSLTRGGTRSAEGDTQTCAASAPLLLPERDTTPPGPVTDLRSTATATAETVTWTIPTDADLAGFTVRSTAGSAAPAAPADGAPVQLTAPSAASVTDAGLSPDTTYSYAPFSRDATGNVNLDPVTVTTRTSRPGPV